MIVYGEMIEIEKLTETCIKTMFTLMNTFYDHMLYDNFTRDLSEKDYCILLKDEAGKIQGFSTQKLISFSLKGKEIHGVFSGDTIIHKDYWGSMALYRTFAQSFIEYGKQFSEFYWFLISKGYKTYKMLPLFYKTFYPNYQDQTPDYEKQIIDAFGQLKYPGEYNEKTGVIEYRGEKDKLKEGVADITPKQLKDKNIQFFINANPNYIHGQDLVCLARLELDNLHNTTRRMFMEE
ncbi:MAG: hypothetical protein CVU84_01875 [Firmicutes bacterium HGW-Firmicutes-1]|jgi:hypothetical protein|nr:MAG: hypothetical protein CVU84_01875 [Firmicutes bacterium HGW-Firmicutes-1]